MTTTLAPPERPTSDTGPEPPTAPAPPAKDRKPRRRLFAAVGAAVLAAVAVGLIVVGLSSGDDAPKVELGKPQIVTAGQLTEFAGSVGHPVYWAGPPAAGFKLELTEVKGGSTFVRYLSSDAPAGDKRPNFTTVGTYPSKGAYDRAKQAADRKGAEALDRGDRGLALWYRKAPTNVYVAKPGNGSPLVEVYAPNGKAAQQLAGSDQVVPVR